MEKVASIALASWFVVLVVGRWRRMSPAERRTAAPVVWATSGPLGSFLFFFTIDTTGVHNALVWQTYFWLNRITNFCVPLALLIGLLTTSLARADVTALLVRLRTASVDELRPALARLLRDPLLQIALPSPDGNGYVDPAGRPLDVAADDRRVVSPISHDVLLLHHSSARTEDPQLFDAAVAAMAMTLDNARLTAQVRAQLAEVSASRARLVAAADQQRRRIERDLHDGAQQQLLELGMSLQAARTTVPDDSPAARFLDEATSQLHDSLAELRALSRGLRRHAESWSTVDSRRRHTYG
jgi:signal transduction histidine kinase